MMLFEQSEGGLTLSRLGGAVLGCGLALTTATRLRLPGLPVGPGELVLLVLLLLGGVALVRRDAGDRVGLLQKSRVPLLFWCAFAICLAAGSVMGQSLGVLDVRAGVRECLALVFCAAYTVWLHVLDWDSKRMQRVLVVCGGTVVLINSLIVISETIPLLSSVDAIFCFVRLLQGSKSFYGWSTNINQTILPIVLALPLFFAGAMHKDASRLSRLFGICLVVLMIIYGITVFSRAFIIAMALMSCAALVYGTLCRLKATRYARVLFGAGLALAMVLYTAIAMYVAYTVPVLCGVARQALLANGMHALLASWGIGLGPGAHVGLYTTFGDMEVHNILVDAALSGGIPAALVLGILLIQSARAVVSLEEHRWLFCWFGLFVMSMLHNLIRHPIFWTMAFAPLLLVRFSTRSPFCPHRN